MKKFALAFAALAALPLAAAADVSKEDIRKLVAAGVGEEVILAFIRANGPAQKLSADEVVELKQAGASERVLGALMGNAPAAAPARRIETVERVVEKQVYVPQTTYVYSTPAYYPSTYYSPSYAYGYCSPYSYPRSYYGGYYGSYYRGYSGYRYYGPRVGVSVGWCW